jgi:LacI family transcriptional regulator
LIVTNWPEFFSKSALNRTAHVPKVIINDLDEDLKVQFVCGDQYSGGRIAAEHLYSLGHRDMAVFTGLAWSTDSHARLKGFRDYLREKGVVLKEENVLCANYRGDLAFQMTEELVKRSPEVTAIFCCNDEMAFGVIRKLNDLQIACPGDISVVGFDDISRAEACTPPLTTVHDPVYEMALEGARLLVDHLTTGAGGPLVGRKIFPVKLMNRQSTSRRV